MNNRDSYSPLRVARDNSTNDKKSNASGHRNDGIPPRGILVNGRDNTSSHHNFGQRHQNDDEVLSANSGMRSHN